MKDSILIMRNLFIAVIIPVLIWLFFTGQLTSRKGLSLVWSEILTWLKNPIFIISFVVLVIAIVVMQKRGNEYHPSSIIAPVFIALIVFLISVWLLWSAPHLSTIYWLGVLSSKIWGLNF